MINRVRLALCAMALVLLASATASAQAPLIRGFGGPADFGVGQLPPGDNGSSPPLDLMVDFPGGLFFGGRFHIAAFVNLNGSISFGEPIDRLMPAFPGSFAPLFGAWWGNVDTSDATPPLPGMGVYWHQQPGLLIATWNTVGYYNRHRDRVNSFQISIIDASSVGAPGDFDVEYRYNRCEWIDADPDMAGMSIVAQAGYEAPPFETMPGRVGTLPGSGTTEMLRLCGTSNVGAPGIWRFAVRGGVVSTCGNGRIEPGEECDGPRTPAGFGCTVDCRLCDGDAAISCGPGDAGGPDVEMPDIVFPDVEFPDVEFPDIQSPDGESPDVVEMDAAIPHDAPNPNEDVFVPDASAMDAGRDADPDARVLVRYDSGGLCSCRVAGAPAPSRTTPRMLVLAGLLAVSLSVRRRATNARERRDGRG